MSSNPTSFNDTSDREIVTTRVFDAPRDLVFAAWMDPDQLALWFGPNGFSITNHHADMRVGGTWKFTMHGPDGVDYPNVVRYTEIVPSERIAYTHTDKDEAPEQRFFNTVTFTDEGQQTRVTMRAVFPTAAEKEKVVREFNAIEGGRQTLARLGDHLKQLA